MMKSRGWRLVGASVSVLGLALAGCGGGGDGGTEDPEPQGPLAEFFGWDEEEFRGEQEASEEERQQHYEVQEYTVECMQEAGFDYFPEPFWGDQEDGGGFEDPFEDVWQLQQDDPEAFAKEYGYGITTIDYGETEEPAPETEPSADPNWEYQESLSEAARAEYEKALWGDWEAVEEEAGDDPEAEIDPAEVGGCQNEAYDEVYGFGGEDEGQFEDLWEEWDKLYERTESDPRLADAKQAWINCMADAGHSGLNELFDGQEQVYEKQSELYGWDDEEAVAEAERAEAEATDPDDPDADEPIVEESPFEPFEPDPAVQAELRDFELAIAWADYECKQEHDVERIEREVRFEYEEEFIEANRAELEAYRDWMNESGIRG